MDYILQKAKDYSILDFGSADGLVSYECVRNGAKIIHGFEISRRNVNFAKRLFRDVPIESKFIKANLAVNGKIFEKKYRKISKENESYTYGCRNLPEKAKKPI